jgi:hypothetical protein
MIMGGHVSDERERSVGNGDVSRELERRWQGEGCCYQDRGHNAW